MIANERQYRITKAEANRFEAALGKIDEQNSHLHPRLRQAMRDGMESVLSILREQLAAYDALCAGQVTVIEAESLAALPDVLIQACTAAGLKIREQIELPRNPRAESAGRS